MLSVLDQFDLDLPEWTFDELHAKLGFSRSTLYRYLKTLCDAGLLSTLPGHGYTLGPRIIEMDYQIIVNDPLIHAARPIMEELTETYHCVSLLCRHYRNKVLCVHQESSTTRFRSNYDRGRARPLLRGAASLSILAHYSAYQLGKLYERIPEEFAEQGLGASLAEVRESLRGMRQPGWIVTEGHVTPGVTGIAAPIFDGKEGVVGSLSLTLPESAISDERRGAIGERVLFCARIVSKSLGAI